MPGPLIPEFHPRERLGTGKLNEIARRTEVALGSIQGPGYTGTMGSYGAAPDQFVILALVTGSSSGAHSWVEYADDPRSPGTPVAKDDGIIGTTSLLPLYEINGATLLTGHIYYAWRGANEYYLTEGEACCEAHGTATASAVTTDQNDYVIPNSSSGVPAEIVRVPVNATSTFTGFDHTIVGQSFTFVNTGSATAYFENQSSSSSSDNRIITKTGGRTVVVPGATATFVYDETSQRYRITGGTATYDEATSTATFTTSQNNYDVTTNTGGATEVQYWDIQNDLTVTGVYLPPGLPSVTIINNGDSTATFTHQDASSSSTNRISTQTGTSVRVPPKGSIVLKRNPDGTGLIISGGTSAPRPGDIALVPVSPPSTPSTGSVIYVDSGDAVLKAKDSTGAVIPLGGSSSSPSTTINLTVAPTWFYKAITVADLTLANTTQDVTVYSLPAKGAMHAVVVRTKTAGSGGGVTSIILYPYIAGSAISDNSGDGMVANNTGAQYWPDARASDLVVYSWTTTTGLGVRFVADINVDQISGGEWEVYMLLSTLG